MIRLVSEWGARWSGVPLVVLPVASVACLYLAGVRRVGRRRPSAGWPVPWTASFLAGLAVLIVALASPLDALADDRFWGHMVQHLLLTLIAPPLLLLGRPVRLAYAATSSAARSTLAAITRSGPARVVGSPVAGFAAFAAFLWVSHLSGLYALSIRDEALHALEHSLYLATALLFWWPVVAKDPGSGTLSPPARLLYVFVAMPVMSLLGLIIGYGDRVLYAHYIATDGSVASALADQRLAGTLMWGSSMIAGVAALSWVMLDWMRRDDLEARRIDGARDRARARRPRTRGAVTAGTGGS